MHRTSLNSGWSVRPNVGPFGEAFGAGAEWVPVTLPHDALISAQRSPTAPAGNAYFPGGEWDYKRTLDLGAEQLGRVTMLQFEGVYRNAVVTVNDSIVAHRPYGYSEFSVRIDHLLHEGENSIRVAARAHLDSRWYSGGGIYRNVWLLQSGPVRLVPDGLVVQTPELDDQLAVVAVAADVVNGSGSTVAARLRVELFDAQGSLAASGEEPVTLFPGETLTARQRLHINRPRRWDLDAPHLYTCRATLLSDESELDVEETGFGVRTLSLDPRRGLRINDKEVLLRGACVHHDNGPIGAATIDRADARRVELLKAAGFNAIRSAHHPMSRRMLDACDRLGVVVMDETFDMWTEPKAGHDYALDFATWWEADVEAMVRKSRNHPSVIFYSIGNEIPDGSTAEGLHRGRELAEKVRSLDDTRFVTQAVSGFVAARTALMAHVREQAPEASLGDEEGSRRIRELVHEAMTGDIATEALTEAFSFLDLAGYNYMDMRFALDGKLFPNRVIVTTESYGPSIDTEWAGVTDNSHVIGDFAWTGWDYLGEVGLGRVAYADPTSDVAVGGVQGTLAPYPWLLAWCADIDITGHRRPQSYFREIVYGLRQEPYIAVQPPADYGRVVTRQGEWAFNDVRASWSWPSDEGRPVHVEVYSSADEVELLLNGESLGRQPAGRSHRYKAEFTVDYQPGELQAIAWDEGKHVARTSLRSAVGDVWLRLSADRAAIKADPFDAAFVDVELTDAAGTTYNGCDRMVTVEVSGPGVLQGFASANPVTEESFCDAECTTFGGRALAVIRPMGPGEITVTVAAADCEPTALVLTAG